MCVHELDGIFNRDNMPARVMITIPDHDGLGRAFSGAGAADKEHEPTAGHGYLLQNSRWQI